MKNKLDIGKEIKNKRLSLNLTMDAVANKAGITRATLSALENGSLSCSLKNFYKVCEVLEIDLTVKSNVTSNKTRKRATRINTILDSKINFFIIMCIEEYAKTVNKSSDVIYKKMVGKKVIEELKKDYEDLHGMSKEYLNSYIDALLKV